MKLIGSKAAMNLLNGKQDINIPNIIHSGFVLCHSVVTVPGCVSEKSIVLYGRSSVAAHTGAAHNRKEEKMTRWAC
ncbi:MAG TPA: hypothetical protein VN937_14475 [Blastocatellia bacterium]|nr:hypothetical protein [Blastocatellia bacterium]